MSIDWSLFPKDVVAISMHDDFSGGAPLLLTDKGELESYCDPCGSLDIIVAVNPSHCINLVSVLNRRKDRLIYENDDLKRKIKELEKQIKGSE